MKYNLTNFPHDEKDKDVWSKEKENSVRGIIMEQELTSDLGVSFY